jgi:cytochrome c biogenesis protein CcdA
MKKIALLFILSISTLNLFAQNGAVPMADVMRSNGKIYVVVAVLLVILIGLIVYLFSLDKRLKMLEKKSIKKN